MIEGIVQVLIGGLLALAGAFIGPFFQRRHERWRAKREDEQTLRGMAAELFNELDRIVHESNQSNISAIKRLIDNNAEPFPLPDLGKIRMLVSVYFPTASEIVTRFEKESDALSDQLAKEIENAVKQSSSAEKIKVLNGVLVTQRNKQAYSFVKEMRTHMANVIPRLQ